MLILALCLAITRASAAEPPCPPADLQATQGTLPHLAARLKPNGHIDILAVGIGAAATRTAPKAAAEASSTLLNRFAQSLQAQYPGLQLQITMVGQGGLPAAAQRDLITSALHQHPYQLVLWQTGTVDAVNDESAADFYQALSDGADAIHAQNAELVLITPQYSRFLDENAALAPYLQALEAISALPGVLLFHRYEVMHGWVEAGSIDLESAPTAQRSAIAARLHACLGEALARTLRANAATAPP